MSETMQNLSLQSKPQHRRGMKDTMVKRSACFDSRLRGSPGGARVQYARSGLVHVRDFHSQREQGRDWTGFYLIYFFFFLSVHQD